MHTLNMVSHVMAVWCGDSCNGSLKMLQPTPCIDSNESSYQSHPMLKVCNCGEASNCKLASKAYDLDKKSVSSLFNTKKQKNTIC